ncbi:MAG: type II toxin-antitoxin system RatA family toxin [Gammaproteobacteria bacterium]|nr:type II toxin-antitoxin system RatA family toxin [Gammaproteobacteria bacterium]
MKEYQVERLVTYEAERLFDLIADVERYPEFLPGWKEARVHHREPDAYHTQQTLQLGPVRVDCATRTALHRPTRIEVVSREWPFRELRLVWRLEPLDEAGCRLRLHARVDCSMVVLRLVLDRMLPALVQDIVNSFERRARQLYGPPAKARPVGSTPDNPVGSNPE